MTIAIIIACFSLQKIPFRNIKHMTTWKQYALRRFASCQKKSSKRLKTHDYSFVPNSSPLALLSTQHLK